MDDEIDREELLQKLAYELTNKFLDKMSIRELKMGRLLIENGYITIENTSPEVNQCYYVLARKDKLE